MTTTQATVTTTKNIDLGELDVSLGSHGLLGSENLIMTVVGSPVTQQQLQTAVDNYPENKVDNSEKKRLRQNAFIKEADPLFFGWQRGENTEQEWLDKVAEIRARYPYSSDG